MTQFSDSSYLFPIQRILQNEVMTARFEANSILDLGWFNEEHLLLVGFNSVTFIGRTIAWRDEAVIDCLIKWVQLASAVDHSPALNRSCLRAWTQLAYFLSFSTNSVFLLHFGMSRIFYFTQCLKRQGGVNNLRVILVSLEFTTVINSMLFHLALPYKTLQYCWCLNKNTILSFGDLFNIRWTLIIPRNNIHRFVPLRRANLSFSRTLILFRLPTKI